MKNLFLILIMIFTISGCDINKVPQTDEIVINYVDDENDLIMNYSRFKEVTGYKEYGKDLCFSDGVAVDICFDNKGRFQTASKNNKDVKLSIIRNNNNYSSKIEFSEFKYIVIDDVCYINGNTKGINVKNNKCFDFIKNKNKELIGLSANEVIILYFPELLKIEE